VSTPTLYRLSGLTILVGALLFAVGNLLHPLDHSLAARDSATWEIAHVTFMLGGIVMALGLPGAYLRQAARAGRLGLAGFVALFLGLIVIAPGAWFEAFVVNEVGPELTETIEDGAGGVFNGTLGLLLVAGPLLFGIATLRARVFPRPAAIASIATTPILLLLGGVPGKAGGAAIIFGTVLLSAAYSWIGYALAAGDDATARTGPDEIEAAAPLRRAA
jgi:hypothetical protein